MQELKFSFPATRRHAGRAHVGVVSSGDLEILMRASSGEQMQITVTTSVEGYESIWEATLERFSGRHPVALQIDIHDFGATPGMVSLRLQQALDSMGDPHE